VTDHNLRVYDSMLDLLPNRDNPTPLVELTHVTGFHFARVFAKLEWYNPFGSVKDRVAANLVRDALERGDQLSNLVEPTSGNTGLGLVMVANAHRFGFSAVMSNAVPQEKRTALRVFGADVIELDDDLST
jgi:cysteine synthase